MSRAREQFIEKVTIFRHLLSYVLENFCWLKVNSKEKLPQECGTWQCAAIKDKAFMRPYFH